TTEPGGGETTEPGGGETTQPGGGNNGNNNGGNHNGGNQNGGNGNGGTDNGTDGGTDGGSTDSPVTPDDSTDGGSTGSGAGDPGTCTVDLDGAECVDTGNNNTDTNNAGSQPVQQGQAKEELAETGAAETSFLIIGAATMIAGGIGFRMLPRLVGGGGNVAV
ncbi:LPXTG cell wall anchor domain-containing protein, partial [Streptomyces sp. NPDC055721]